MAHGWTYGVFIIPNEYYTFDVVDVLMDEYYKPKWWI